MREDAIEAGGNPFDPRAALALVLVGAALFLALLWMIGAGWTGGSSNDGGSHAEAKGLNGFAAFADYLERRGFAVRRSRSAAALDDPGLLVLTPPAQFDGGKLNSIVARRRNIGPTLVIAPKWLAMPLPKSVPGAKTGWIEIAGTSPPEWQGFLDDVTVALSPMRAHGRPAYWRGAGLNGALPVAEQVLSGAGPRLVPLVTGVQDNRMLAAYVADGRYPALAAIARPGPRATAQGTVRYPLVLVFEPDLIDNYGLADAVNAALGERLVHAVGGGSSVIFDLTLNGYAFAPNLLTLAFTPPFLAATLCLVLAALAAGWRTALRFGAPLRPQRAIAFGKRALVTNSAGLIARSRRLHLLAAPYAANARERLRAALAIPRQPEPGATDAAIDRAMARRDPEATPFSVAAARLAAATRSDQMLTAAQDIHALERMFTR